MANVLPLTDEGRGGPAQHRPYPEQGARAAHHAGSAGQIPARRWPPARHALRQGQAPAPRRSPQVSLHPRRHQARQPVANGGGARRRRPAHGLQNGRPRVLQSSRRGRRHRPAALLRRAEPDCAVNACAAGCIGPALFWAGLFAFDRSGGRACRKQLPIPGGAGSKRRGGCPRRIGRRAYEKKERLVLCL